MIGKICTFIFNDATDVWHGANEKRIQYNLIISRTKNKDIPQNQFITYHDTIMIIIRYKQYHDSSKKWTEYTYHNGTKAVADAQYLLSEVYAKPSYVPMGLLQDT